MIQHVPWLSGILYQLPGAADSIGRLRRFAMAKAKHRKEKGAVVHDLFYHLVRPNISLCTYYTDH